ncbi:MAG: ATP-binding protein [Bacteroidota bacterium]|nr:ATP-binding protein [Bacteroidota bacterium]
MKKYTLPKIAGAVLVLMASLSCMANGPEDLPARKGLLDLRALNLFDKAVTLDGEWGMYWERLVSPDSLRAAGSPAFTNFPTLWKDLNLNGQKLSSQGYATYTLTVLLPKKRPRIGMEVPDVYCAYKLFVNGVVQVQNGEPAATEARATPFWTTRTIALPSGERDTLVLVLQVANFWHAKGGPYKEILLGDKDALFLKKNRDNAFDLVLGGCMFMGGLFFLGLFVFGRHDKTTLYFSLFCILYSYRMVGTDGYVLHTLFSNIPWYLTVRMEYITLSLGAFLFCSYTRHLFPNDTHPIVMKATTWFCLLYSAIILLTPTIIFTGLLHIFLVVMFLCIGYALYVNLRAARNHRSGSFYALLSTVVMLLILLLSNLHYFGLVPPLKLLIFFGYLSFFFLQSLALSHRFADTFKRATLQAQQGLKAKSEFLSTMSHEIRTPLNAVIGMTHLLLANKPRTDQKEDLDVLLFSASNLLSIVNNILDYNKIEEGKISFEQIPMDLAAISRNIVAGLKTAASEKGIALLMEIDGRLDNKLIGDPTRTSQVITNLVHNAIKFTREGSVRLYIRVNYLQSGPAAVTVRVEDTGIGIAREKQQMIFDRFTQADSSTSRSYGGTGLGLAITRRILELQGVTLHLESEPGKGSIFYFTQDFPLSSEMAGEKTEGPDPAAQRHLLKGICLLLVEDNPLNVLVAQTILENSGATVDVASNGQEALDMLDTRRHQLVLMDLHMPVMDGYEATVLLRRRGVTLPIVALTASTPKEVESEAFAAGLTDVVVKPFNPDDLYRVILQYIPSRMHPVAGHSG